VISAPQEWDRLKPTLGCNASKEEEEEEEEVCSN
jgi:hypothetical protein